jgi:hypothetical protein|tara:strand:- start:10391 stop:10636 length:246 start_codon:yes stop_codon:yes gene_type:complete
MNRQQRRAFYKKLEKNTSKNFSNKISQFTQLPEECDACRKPFDKTDKKMVESWTVVTRQEAVRLFCTQCIEKTKEILNESK